LAAEEGQVIAFTAKFSEREGPSCHIHCSLAREDGSNAFAADQALFDHFVAGQLACMEELTLLYAPHVNSYKRFAKGSFAPTAVAWGHDNRTCSLRVVGHGPGMRFENRAGGAALNPYMATSAQSGAASPGHCARCARRARGRAACTGALEREPALEGTASAAKKPRVPTTLRE